MNLLYFSISSLCIVSSLTNTSEANSSYALGNSQVQRERSLLSVGEIIEDLVQQSNAFASVPMVGSSTGKAIVDS